MGIKIQGFSSTGGGGSGLPQYGSLPAYYNIGNGQEEGNSNPAQIPFNSPAFGTTLFFVSTDRGSNSSNDGYISTASAINVAQNSGLTYWEYVWASYMPNTDINSGIVATNSAMLGRWIGISETLRSVDGANCPSLVNQWIVNNSGNTSASANVTINDGEIIVVAAGVEFGGGQITSITSNSGITWNRRSSKSQIPSSNNNSPQNDHQTLEIWYAINNTGINITEDITLAYSSQFDDQAMVVTTWSGADLVTPWAN